MYSRASVVSAEMPFAVRYSSRLVRRYAPLTRNSKGVGFSDCSNPFTRVDRAYRRKFVGTRMGPVLSGSESPSSLVVSEILTWAAVSDCAMFDGFFLRLFSSAGVLFREDSNLMAVPVASQNFFRIWRSTSRAAMPHTHTSTRASWCMISKTEAGLKKCTTWDISPQISFPPCGCRATSMFT